MANSYIAYILSALLFLSGCTTAELTDTAATPDNTFSNLILSQFEGTFPILRIQAAFDEDTPNILPRYTHSFDTILTLSEDKELLDQIIDILTPIEIQLIDELEDPEVWFFVTTISFTFLGINESFLDDPVTPNPVNELLAIAVHPSLDLMQIYIETPALDEPQQYFEFYAISTEDASAIFDFIKSTIPYLENFRENEPPPLFRPR